MSSRTIMEMFISSYYSKVLVPCLLSMNSHSSPQFRFGFTYIEFSTIRANNCVYKILLILHDISCLTVKVRPFLNVNEAPSIKLEHVIHLLSEQMVMIHENQILMTRSLSDFSAVFCC